MTSSKCLISLITSAYISAGDSTKVTWKFVASPSTTASGVSGKTAEKQALFTTLEYTGDSFGTPGSTDKFSIKDSEQITFSDLSPKARKKFSYLIVLI